MSALGSACFDDDGRDEDRDAHAGVSDHGMIYHIYIYRCFMSMMLIMKKETKVMIMSLMMAWHTILDT